MSWTFTDIEGIIYFISYMLVLVGIIITQLTIREIQLSLNDWKKECRLNGTKIKDLESQHFQ